MKLTIDREADALYLDLDEARAFGLAWDDCEELLHQLGFSPRVEVVAA